jgi:hypothetical protein
MKLASYTIDGRDRFGIVVDGGVIDLNRRVQSSTLRELIACEPNAVAPYAGESPDHSLSAITLRPPIPDPGMLICIGLNRVARAPFGFGTPFQALDISPVAAFHHRP